MRQGDILILKWPQHADDYIKDYVKYFGQKRMMVNPFQKDIGVFVLAA